MSRLEDLRVALAGVIDAAAGVNASYPYPPSTIATNGTAWADRITAGVSKAMSHETHLMSVQVFVVANRSASAGQALEATEAVLDSVMGEVRTHQNLGGLVDYVEIEGYDEVPVAVGGSVYVGFQLNLTIKQRVLVNYSP